MKIFPLLIKNVVFCYFLHFNSLNDFYSDVLPFLGNLLKSNESLGAFNERFITKNKVLFKDWDIQTLLLRNFRQNIQIEQIGSNTTTRYRNLDLHTFLQDQKRLFFRPEKIQSANFDLKYHNSLMNTNIPTFDSSFDYFKSIKEKIENSILETKSKIFESFHTLQLIESNLSRLEKEEETKQISEGSQVKLPQEKSINPLDGKESNASASFFQKNSEKNEICRDVEQTAESDSSDVASECELPQSRCGSETSNSYEIKDKGEASTQLDSKKEEEKDIPWKKETDRKTILEQLRNLCNEEKQFIEMYAEKLKQFQSKYIEITFCWNLLHNFMTKKNKNERKMSKKSESGVNTGYNNFDCDISLKDSTNSENNYKSQVIQYSCDKKCKDSGKDYSNTSEISNFTTQSQNSSEIVQNGSQQLGIEQEMNELTQKIKFEHPIGSVTNSWLSLSPKFNETTNGPGFVTFTAHTNILLITQRDFCRETFSMAERFPENNDKTIKLLENQQISIFSRKRYFELELENFLCKTCEVEPFENLNEQERIKYSKDWAAIHSIIEPKNRFFIKIRHKRLGGEVLSHSDYFSNDKTAKDLKFWYKLKEKDEQIESKTKRMGCMSQNSEHLRRSEQFGFERSLIPKASQNFSHLNNLHHQNDPCEHNLAPKSPISKPECSYKCPCRNLQNQEEVPLIIEDIAHFNSIYVIAYSIVPIILNKPKILKVNLAFCSLNVLYGLCESEVESIFLYTEQIEMSSARLALNQNIKSFHIRIGKIHCTENWEFEQSSAENSSLSTDCSDDTLFEIIQSVVNEPDFTELPLSQSSDENFHSNQSEETITDNQSTTTCFTAVEKSSLDEKFSKSGSLSCESTLKVESAEEQLSTLMIVSEMQSSEEKYLTDSLRNLYESTDDENDVFIAELFTIQVNKISENRNLKKIHSNDPREPTLKEKESQNPRKSFKTIENDSQDLKKVLKIDCTHSTAFFITLTNDAFFNQMIRLEETLDEQFTNSQNCDESQ